MSVAAASPVIVRKYRLADVAKLLLLFLGFLSFAAVSQMQAKCEPVYLTLDGVVQTLGQERLTDGRQCHVEMQGLRIPLPGWLPLL